MRLVNLFLEFLLAGLCLFMAHTAQASIPPSFHTQVAPFESPNTESISKEMEDLDWLKGNRVL